MGSKQIDVVVKYFYPVAAGIETNVLETYSVLVKKGWKVRVHTCDIDYTTNKTLKKNEKLRGIEIIRYPLGRFGFFPQIPFAERGLICLHNFDILPHIWILAISAFRRAIGKKKYRLVVTTHGGFNPEWRVFSPVAAFIKRIYHYSLGVALINYAVDGVRAVSEWEKEEMVKKGVTESKISVISNGLENDAFANLDKLASKQIKDRVREFGDYIIQIGRIYPIKNYETTIKAISLVPNIKFLIVGPLASEKYKSQLISLSRKLGVEKRVIFAGVVRGVDKYYLIKKAKMMVHMAIWESFCNVVHEGMSQGLVCIVANNTALPYLIKDRINGFCVETKDHAELSRKIKYVLDPKNKNIIEIISKNNTRYSSNETWAEVASKMDKMYTTLLK